MLPFEGFLTSKVRCVLFFLARGRRSRREEEAGEEEAEEEGGWEDDDERIYESRNYSDFQKEL